MIVFGPLPKSHNLACQPEVFSVRRSKVKAAVKRRPKSVKKSVRTITFYRANEKPYGVFSNLFRRPVEFAGVIYPTAEHAYQAGKALKPEVRDWIQAAPTPALAAMAFLRRSHPIFADKRTITEPVGTSNLTHVAAGFFIRPLPRHSVHFGG